MESDFQIRDGDYTTEMVEGVLTVKFSPKVHGLIGKRMENTLVVKLIGRYVGFTALLNRIQALWKPICHVQLMDLDNNYYLVRFGNKGDLERVLMGGPWVMFGHYLSVQPWMASFSTERDVFGSQVVWVRLPALPECFNSECLLREIDQLIGTVVKIDLNMRQARRGRFARLGVNIDLSKPLVSKIRIKIQRVEYEGLPTVCFKFGLFGHGSEVCPEVHRDCNLNGARHPVPVVTRDAIQKFVKEEAFGLWMILSVDSGGGRRIRQRVNKEVVGASVQVVRGSMC